MSRYVQSIAEAERARSLGHLERAISLFDAAIADGAADARTFGALGSILHARGDVERAVAAYKSALAAEPDENVMVKLAALTSPIGSELHGISLLDAWLKQHRAAPAARAQLGRLLATWRRRNDAGFQEQIQKQRTRLAEMEAELFADPVYRPSLFWQKHIVMHNYLLETYGVENFKRTVSHNYQNWLMTDVSDPQVSRLAALMNIDFANTAGAVPAADDVGFHFITHAEQHPSDKPLFNLQETGQFADNVLYPFYPLADPSSSAVYGNAVRALWDYTALRHGDVTAGLAESDIGNPIRIFAGDKLISSDIAHSVREQAQILQQSSLAGTEGKTVAELGAGHGRLAELFGRTTNFRYFIFDITPALYVSEWYIRRLFPGEQIFKFRPFAHYDYIADELSQSRFAFFTANQLALLPDNFVDIFININSLMEMRKDQIELFTMQIGRISSQLFFCKQWIDWTNGIDAIRTTQEDFDLGTGWRRISDERDDIYQDFFTSLWRKTT